jgi:calcineurin-like phosphoesterase family protein
VVRTLLCAGGIVLALAAPAHAGFRDGPYLQAVTPTGVTIVWRAERAQPARVIVEGPGLPAGGAVVEGVGRAEIRGLAPASRYRYVVELPDARATGELATALPPGDGAPFTFVAFGDNGLAGEGHRRIVEQVLAAPPDFVVSTGDMVEDSSRAELWHRLLAVEQPLIANIVLFPTFGNHDVRAGGVRNDTARGLYALPEHTTDEELYYAFSYGRSRFVMLDSNARGAALAAETAWLDGELAAARESHAVDHVFVVMHHPMFSVSHHGGKPPLRDAWTPLFARYHVDAVLSGHDHVYERGAADGVHYFVSGGGGADTYTRRSDASAADTAAIERFESVRHFLRVTVRGPRVEVAAIRNDGTVIETTAWSTAVARPRATTSSIDPAPAATAPVAAPVLAAAVVVPEPAGLGALALFAFAGTVLVLLAVGVVMRVLRA